MPTDEKHKQVNLDIATYEKIKSNGAKANRSIAGEIRQMLAILSTPKEDGTAGYNDGKRVVMVKHADGRIEITPEFAATGTQQAVEQEAAGE